MKHHLFQFFCVSLMIVVLSACGGSTMNPPDYGGGGSDEGVSGEDGDGAGDGSGTDQPAVSPFTAPTEAQALYFVVEMPDEFAAVRANYNTGGFTLLADLPGSGFVSYDGFMEINIASTPVAAVRSTASLTVDMQSGTMSGGANAFMGWVYNAETDSTELALYEGDIAFSGGSLTSGTLGDTRLSVQVDGALDNGLQGITLTGTLDGRIYGADGDGIYAGGSYYGIGRDITLTADEVDVYGDANIWALKR